MPSDGPSAPPRPGPAMTSPRTRTCTRTTRHHTRAGIAGHDSGTRCPQNRETETERVLACLEALPGVTEAARGCITRLLHYRAVRTRARLPRGPSAAVLVPLFVGRTGDVYVLLSRRSDALSSFAGDTALPGGRMDKQDRTVEDTARREAFEEVGIPRDKARVPLLCVMEPHLAKGEILVTPVVVLIVDYSVQPNLNSSEVTSIFARPLVSFLSSTGNLSGGRTPDPSQPYHAFTDLPWNGGGAIRLHRFLTGREEEGVKPVYGLTASILIKTASIGYGRGPDFEVQPLNAPTSAQQIAHALLAPANPLRIACGQEGIDADEAAARLLRPPVKANTGWTFKWRKIGLEWKKRMDGSGVAGVSTRVNTAVEKGNDSGGDGNPGKREVREPVEDIKRRTQDPIERGSEEDWERLDAKIEEYKMEANERGEQAEGHDKLRGKTRRKTPDVVEPGEFFDKKRDILDERMKKVRGDEEKLSEVSKAYPKMTEQVKKELQGGRSEDNERKGLSDVIPKGVPEGLKDGMKAGKEGIQRGRGNAGDSEEKDQGVEKGKEGGRVYLDEMEKYIGKSGDGHNPKQVCTRKHDAKL